MLKLQHSDPEVEFVVVDQQNLFAFERDDLFFLVRQDGVRFSAGLPEHPLQIGREERFRDESGNARLSRLIFDVGPVVRGQDDDGRVLSDDLANAANRFNPVHIGHQPVHDINFEMVSVAERFLRADDGFLAGNAPFAAHPDLPEHVGDALAGVDVVVHDQTAQAFQFRDHGVGDPLVGELEIQRDDELGAFVLLRGDGDLAAHHLHDVLCNRHPEPGPLNA